MFAYTLIITTPFAGKAYAELFAPTDRYVSGKRVTEAVSLADWDEWVSKTVCRSVTRVSDVHGRNKYTEPTRTITYEVQPRFTVFPASVGTGWLIRDCLAMVNGTKGDFVRVGGYAVVYPTRADAETIVKELNQVQEGIVSEFYECPQCDGMVRISYQGFHAEFECAGEPLAANAGSSD